MVTPRQNHSVVSIGAAMYLIGGMGFYNDYSFSDTVEVFDAATRTFKQGPSLPVRIKI